MINFVFLTQLWAMVSLWFMLMAAHFLCDYPLQGEFLSKAKAEGPLPAWHLWGHAWIHAGAVVLLTGSMLLGLLELFAHVAIDGLKIVGRTTFAQDQALHVACKVLWVFLYWFLWVRALS